MEQTNLVGLATQEKMRTKLKFSNEAKKNGAERLKTRFFLFCNNGSGNIGFIRKRKVI
ncbi:hypothetical protein Syun_031816 [Stephania yunnanensis]|uniref:Uncharacterized protein n=1 Tax=Stephania yunnanensis TaxID=152371 RepID=A0AAP0DWN9_9MAGN